MFCMGLVWVVWQSHLRGTRPLSGAGRIGVPEQKCKVRTLAHRAEMYTLKLLWMWGHLEMGQLSNKLKTLEISFRPVRLPAENQFLCSPTVPQIERFQP
jgi:hypothetical protein